MSNYFHRHPLLLGCCLLLASPCYALNERLDDSASPRGQVEAPQVLSNTGGLLSDSNDATQAILKFGRVDYKLATAKYIGQKVRIDYVIPATIPGLLSPSGLLVEWRGNGLFSEGSGRPGDSIPVWTGTIEEAWMSEGLDLTMRVDLDALRLSPGANFGFESYFEIEVLP
jgi:hypothetical protein